MFDTVSGYPHDKQVLMLFSPPEINHLEGQDSAVWFPGPLIPRPPDYGIARGLTYNSREYNNAALAGSQSS